MAQLFIRRSLSTAAALMLMCVATNASAASYRFTTVDAPFVPVGQPRGDTYLFGINNFGDLVGIFADGGSRAFIKRNSKFKVINPPAGKILQPTDINNAGVAVGIALDQAFNSHAFRYQDGSLSVFDYPSAGGTQAEGINDLGVIVGEYFGPSHGFTYSGSAFRTFDYPSPTVSQTAATGINNFGDVVGNYVDANGVRGYLKSANRYSTIAFPGAVLTGANAINSSGVIVGSYDNGSGYPRAFVLANGIFSDLDIPGAYQITAEDINDQGVIVGNFGDGTGEHGYIARPVGLQ